MRSCVLAVVCGMLVGLSGCANPRQIMVNPTTWQQVNCSASGWGWLGAPQAISMVDKCVSNQRVLGNIPIEEVEMQDAPKFSGPASTSQPQAEKPSWGSDSFWTYSVGGNSVKVTVEKIDTFRNGKAYFVKNGSGTQIYNDSLGLAAVMKNGIMDSSYNPALLTYDWPLFVGKQWDSKGELTRNGGTMNLSTHYEVKGFGKVKVPAGEFDTYYILSKSDYGARITELWYSPKAKNYVKGVVYTNSGRSVEELADYKAQ